MTKAPIQGSSGPGSTGDSWSATTGELVAFVRRRVESAEVAEDIVRDVMEKLQRYGPQEIRHPQAWLYRSARNAIIDHYRTKRHHDPVPPDLLDDSEVRRNEPNSATRELARCLRPLIAELPERYRRALTLVDLEGHSQAAAAAVEGISVSGMKSRVQRGRSQLGQLLTICCAVELSVTGSIADYEESGGEEELARLFPDRWLSGPIGAHGRTRTCNRRIRSPVLYPIELRGPDRKSIRSRSAVRPILRVWKANGFLAATHP